MTARVIVFLALTISIAKSETNDRPHLIRVRPNFDVDAPYANTYARLCEKMLFTGPNWVIRYHEISESVETGLSITKKQDGSFWVTVKQAKPQLGPTVSHAFYFKSNLEAALKTLKVVEGHAEIPERAVTAIRRYWIALLSDVRPYERRSSTITISNQVILFANTPDGKTLAGRLPPDAYKYSYIHAVEDIEWDLVKVCVHQQESPKKLFDRIEQRARESADAILKRGER
jgi:hypothetical protein